VEQCRTQRNPDVLPPHDEAELDAVFDASEARVSRTVESKSQAAIGRFFDNSAIHMYVGHDYRFRQHLYRQHVLPPLAGRASLCGTTNHESSSSANGYSTSGGNASELLASRMRHGQFWVEGARA
jgi:hypothetical protein